MGLLPEYFPALTGFQWDAGNSEKNWLAHEVSHAEVEQAFYNRPVLVSPDSRHSQVEVRYYVLGRSNAGRTVAIVFTLRATLVRPIMARDMSRRERRLYAEQENAEEAP
jgi:uncharacterized DUF497 family protein